MTNGTKPYDVFLSYNSEDRAEVETLAIHLRDEAKLKSWFDRWELVPGEPWMQALARGIAASHSCAVFIGKSGQGPWQFPEIEAVLQKQANKSDFRVIPVLLPNAPQKPALPLFLKRNSWVEFKQNLKENDGLWRLKCGIIGQSPGSERIERIVPQENKFASSIAWTEKAESSKIGELFYPGGAIDIDSPFYVRRIADDEVKAGISRPRALLTLRGPRQTGKTSLLLRAGAATKNTDPSNLRVVFLDLQILPQTNFQSSMAVWQAITGLIAEQLSVTGWTIDSWNANITHDQNLTHFFEKIVFQREDDGPVLICIDESDRVFGTPIKTEFFRYNKGAMESGCFRFYLEEGSLGVEHIFGAEFLYR